MSVLDSPTDDRPDLATRVERALVKILADRLPEGRDVRPFHGRTVIPIGVLDESGALNPKPVEKDFWTVIAERGPIATDDPYSGTYRIGCAVSGSGALDPTELDTVETLLATPETVHCEVAALAAEYGFALTGGRCAVEFDGGAAEKGGLDLDYTIRHTFTVIAQAAEVQAAA